VTGVFINYRRRDVPAVAGVLYDQLIERFGEDQVFRDCDSMQAGEHYPTALREGLERAAILIAVIGPEWLTLADEDGVRLLDRDRDWVREEITRAFDRGIRVIPVLVEGAERVPYADLPKDIRELANLQSVRVDHVKPTRDIEALIDRLIEIEPRLAVHELFTAAPKLSRTSPPSALLRAEYSVVPFVGREDELTKLHEWATGPQRVSLQLITGPGGQGKTRLARQLCQQLQERGWITGFVNAKASEQALARCIALPVKALLVFDYAEGSTDSWLALVSALAERPKAGAQVRLLLLARSTAGGRLLRPGVGMADRSRDILDTLRHQPMELPPLLPRDTDRHGEFNRAVAAFAGQLGRPDAGVPAPVDLDHRRYERALDVHAAALASLLDHPDDRVDGHPWWSDPIERVLDHEYGYWQRTAAGLRDYSPDRCHQLAAAATMFGAADDRQARALLLRIPALEDDRAAVDEWLRWFQQLYPGPGGLNPLQPDRLGEDQVAAAVQEDARVATKPARETADDTQLTQALTVLGRAAPRHEHLAAVIAGMVKAQSERMITLGVGVVPGLQDPHPLVQALDEAVGGAAAGTLGAAIDAIDAMPGHSDALGDFAVRTTARALAIHRALPDRDEARIASLQASYALHLAAAGQWPDACEAIAAAVELNTRLADEAPGRRFDLVRSLRIQSQLLGQLGRHDGAAEAAERAVGLCRESGDEPGLGASLTVLATQYAGVARYQEAAGAGAEAVGIYRRLATARPHAYQHLLALTLADHARHLRDLGRVEDSLTVHAEATSLLRELTALYGKVYDSQLALQLSSEAQLLADTGRQEDALTAAEESVGIYHELADVQPDMYRSELAKAMDTLGVALDAVGKYQEAREVMTELAELWRDLAGRAPASYAHPLARSLRLLANEQRKTGDPELALATAAEAIKRYRTLPADGPVAHRSELADFLDAMALWATVDGRFDAAIEAAEGAIAIRRELAGASMEMHGAGLAESLSNAAEVLGRRNRHDEATSACGEAVAIARELTRRWPDRHLPRYARTLTAAAVVLLTGGHEGRAGLWHRAAVAIWRFLVDRDPRYVKDLQQALELGQLLGFD
jgi:tetratricopeptide (TPR) repeat protein